MTSPITDADARTKICPFMRAGSVIPATCFGDECMAWEWIDPVEGEWESILDDKDSPVTRLFTNGEKPDAEPGTIWFEFYRSFGGVTWRLCRIIGPRRGRCGACPRVDVTVER